jgi:glycine cleavage system aminomethyltransferase T
VVSYVTSANYGYTVGRCIVYGYLPVSHSTPGSQVEIEYFGKGLAATVQAEPLYDTKMDKLKS